VLAAFQLFAEISRGLFTYSYPLHDLRLLLIVSLAVGFGVCLLRYVAMKLELKKPWSWTTFGFVITLVAVIAIPGFDAKTTIAILIPTLVCTNLIGYRLFKNASKELMAYFAVFMAFTFTIIINLSGFHDILFYYIITGILCFLFAQQALNLNREQKQRKAEMDYIQTLSKTSNADQKTPVGGGFLLLTGGFEVPVSRRIMPVVRNAIQ